MNALTFGNWTGSLGLGLAERELQCVMAVACGMTSKEAARELGVAKDTIDKRLLAASTKLGVIKRAQLVAEAMRRGLISPAAILVATLAVHGAFSDDQFLRVRRSGGGSERKVELRMVARRVEQQVALA
ncbi:LuxR C-terminal-related transcriptional regulator [Pseudomonas shirazica]|uniref:LuxR C-terminal-related transcriptional regulator n=1 Tax=Pseudomonas shirazica TaxID=1940636 RepID=UPI002452E561|nr:LuxR C-terminal-related transcriptional regulator [Pseudomonas shirazica]MDH4430366.1 LuxR C-terminal-related transcriptional regulator [Pseudomonas shirazica]MDM9598601.1 LuxR C-terminal-related transcriptional regulator [Pseudomonas shirazica]MDO2412029.1 LuxR C-terminal-related transcriptional regulator [Pseudomonas shirazica]